ELSPNAQIRAVIFDMDGVLTDSEPLINAAAIAMFGERGLKVVPEDFLPFVGTGEDRYLGGVAEKYHFALDLAAAKHRTYEIYLELVPTRLRVFPGVVELVAACRQAGLRVVVASSADRIKIVANLQKIGLPIESWDAVVTGEDVMAKKPAPDIFLSAASRLGLPPGQCAVIEDAVNGVQAAKAAGMRCVAVAQTFDAEKLRGADLVRQTIAAVTVQDVCGQALPGASGSQPHADREVRPWGIWATVGLAAAVAVSFVAMQAFVAFIWAFCSAVAHHGKLPRGWESSGLLLAIATCVSAPVAFGFTWLFAHLRKSAPAAEYLGFRGVSVKAMVFWTLALLGLVAGSDLLTVRLGKPVVPEFMQNAYRTAGFAPLLWVALLVAAPIAEETLFRGFLFVGILHSRLGPIGAITITSLVWALIHVQYDAYGVSTVFVTGLLLGLVRLSTGSLYATVFLHFLMNLIATVETVCVLGPLA
ncbi:MAG TPA: HAD-IA family hydrolase, partial [Verrucomicrobiae bacterium]|nr:HAD-IA family hydrolase [Verrucomicrobiae bacterium]